MIGAEHAGAALAAIDALGWTLIDALWQAALLALGYGMLRAFTRAPRLRVALGHVTMLAMVAWPAATFFGHYARSASGAVQGVGLDPATMVVPALRAAEQALPGFETWLPWIVAAWAAGVMLLSLRQWLQWRELRRVCRAGRELGAPWPARFARLRRELGVRLPVRLRQSSEVAVPMLVGILRPTILLPAALLARLPSDQFELILLHELAHLRRFDPLFNLLQTVVDTLLFFHPAVHWVSRRLRDDRELCCDEIVVRQGADRMRYARVLLTLAEAQTPAASTPVLALTATGGVLLHRIERIVDVPLRPEVAPRTLAPLGVLLGFAVVAGALVREDTRWAMVEAARFGPYLELAAQVLPQLRPSVPDLALRIEPLRPARTLPAPQIVAIDSPVAGRGPEAVWGAALPETGQLQPVRFALEPVRPAADLDAPPTGNGIAALTIGAVVDTAPAAVVHPGMAGSVVRMPGLIRGDAPIYPARALEHAIEGSVTLSFRVGPDGRPYALQLEHSEPALEFNRAAREALQRWRYEPGVAEGVQRVRFDFAIDPQAAPEPPAAAGSDAAGVKADCVQRTGSRLCRPLRDTLMRTVQVSGG